MIQLIHYMGDQIRGYPGWQGGWEIIPSLDLASVPRRHVARAPQGTPLPPGTTLYEAPVATPEMLAAAREELEVIAQRGDALQRYLAQDALEDERWLRRLVEEQLGIAHPFASIAPLSVMTADAACRAHVKAECRWDSQHSCAVYRTAPVGYQVWHGVGSYMVHVGHAPTPEAAESMALEAIYALRQRTMADIVANVLPGWPLDRTPYYSATLGSAVEDLPISIRRGPMTAAEAGVSWDLPVVAKYVHGRAVERHDDLVTWSDEESRRAHIERQRQRSAKHGCR